MTAAVSRCAALLFAGLGLAAAAWAADGKVEDLNQPPEGIAADIAAAIHPAGHRVSSGTGAVCDLWLTREPALKPKFKPSLRVKYPFQPGQLVGVIRFAAGTKPTDFRGQELEPGVYTLRYGQQPVDGNHFTENRDFLVACPPKEDSDPKPIGDFKKLTKLSAGSVGSSHPAIFMLNAPPDKPFEAAAARHDSEKDLLILEINLEARNGEDAVKVPISLVAAGKGEG